MTTPRGTQVRDLAGPLHGGGARRPRGRRRPTSWAALGGALALGAGLVGVAPHAALAAPAPDAGPTAGGTVVSDAVPVGFTFTAVSAGAEHTVALGLDGHAYAWGYNSSGQLGDGTTTSSSAPVQVQAPPGVTFTTVTAGGNHTVASGSDGHVYTWGENSLGQLGDGTHADASLPVQVAAPPGTRYTAVTAGGEHTVASLSDGSTHAWGANGDGQLGTGGSSATYPDPQPVAAPGGVTFTAVTAGASHTVATGSDGHTYAWGDNYNGQLGDNSVADASAPTQVQAPPGVTFTDVAAGTRHTLAHGSDGHTYAWGNSSYGQLGAGSGVSASSVPVQVLEPSGVTFTDVTAGANHSLASGSDGHTYAWGNNSFAQLGDGTTTNAWEPVRVQPPTGVDLVATTAGTAHSLATGSDGRTYAWGENFYGQMGTGTTTDSPVPVVLPADVRVTSVSFGGVPGTGLSQSGGTWQVSTPPGCGPVDVEVEYQQYAVTRTLQHPGGFTFGTAPAVTRDPDPATLPPGGPATLTAAASGDDAPTVRWQQQEPAGWVDLPGAVTTTLDVLTPGEYRAVFTNCRGEVATAAARVTAGVDLGASTIAADPARISVGDASVVTVRVVDVTGAPVPGRTVVLDADHPAVASLGAVTDHGDGTYTAPLTGLAAGTVTVAFTVDGARAPGTATVQVDAVTDPGGGGPDTGGPDSGGGGPDAGGGPGPGTGGPGTGTGPGTGLLALTGAEVLGALGAALLAVVTGTVLVHRRRSAG